MLSEYYLDFIADLINPFLAVFVVVISIVKLRKKEIATNFFWIFIFKTSLLVAMAYGASCLDRSLNLYGKVGLDFSGHGAIAISLFVSFCALYLQKTILILLFSLLIFYAMLMIYLNYHSLIDIVTTTAVMVPIAYITHFKFLRKP